MHQFAKINKLRLAVGFRPKSQAPSRARIISRPAVKAFEFCWAKRILGKITTLTDFLSDIGVDLKTLEETRHSDLSQRVKKIVWKTEDSAFFCFPNGLTPVNSNVAFVEFWQHKFFEMDLMSSV